MLLSLNILLSILQLSQAASVYLNPPINVQRSFFSLEAASSALAHHLGLESFEQFRVVDYAETPFVGTRRKNALFLSVEQADAAAVIPASLKTSFSLPSSAESSAEAVSSVISIYLDRAKHTYSSTLEAWNVGQLSRFFESTPASKFATLELASLSDIRQNHGEQSEEYISAVQRIQAFLTEHSDTLQLAVLTYDSPTSRASLKRQSTLLADPIPQEPFGAISTCFTSLDTCNNGTSACSGHGQCMQASKAGRTCFVCTCGITQTGEGSKVKTVNWVGQSCERKDISGPFVLFAGTGIALLLVVIVSVQLLYSVGSVELPSTLLGTAVNAKKD
ncbi:hypothetical protein C8J56DRAFT_1161050 [Mycena floridula]|nr:hypothetical protein C8J56DRAFT_1161050 [Mycena floridula]